MHFVQSYERGIEWILDHCPQPDKFAHTYAGLIIWLGAALLLKRPLRSPVPLLVVIAVEVANESIDRAAHGSWRWPDTLGDAAATWFWPFILTMALARVSTLRR